MKNTTIQTFNEFKEKAMETIKALTEEIETMKDNNELDDANELEQYVKLLKNVTDFYTE